MASVSLETLWVNNAADLSDSAALPLSALTWKPTRQGDVRTYAGGRRRLVTRVGSARSADIALEYVDRDLVNRLDAWTGALLCFRDPMGRKFYGVFLDPSFEEQDDGSDHANVSFTVYEVTHSEEV